MLLLVFATAVSVLAIRQLLVIRLDERIDEGLTNEVREFRQLIGSNDPRTGAPFGSDFRAIFDAHLSREVPSDNEASIAFVGSDPYRSAGGEQAANLVTLTPDLIAHLGNITRPESGEVETPEGPARYLAVPIATDAGTRARFVVASFVAQEREQVEEAVQIAGGVGLAVIAVGSVIAIVASGRVLAPLRELTETAQSITESDLSRRIDVDGDDELAELGHTFNAMLERLDATLSGQRQLLRDVGHELRTPIAIISGHLEFVGDDPEERRETLELVRDELQRMRRLVEDLLILARSERPDFLELETVDLGVLSDEVLAKASSLAERDWGLETRNAGRIVADRQRLTQAMMNLTQNAVAHTTASDSIAIGAECRDGMARVWVSDTGSGIAYEDQGRIFERFARGADADRSQGTGLGLAIVRAIADAHGGEVSLLSRPGEGARFTLTVPIDRPDDRVSP